MQLHDSPGIEKSFYLFYKEPGDCFAALAMSRYETPLGLDLTHSDLPSGREQLDLAAVHEFHLVS
jgi:hypothetical protein